MPVFRSSGNALIWTMRKQLAPRKVPVENPLVILRHVDEVRLAIGNDALIMDKEGEDLRKGETYVWVLGS